MEEKKIVINIDNIGNINSETFGFNGVECVQQLDKLLSDLVNESTITKKDDFFKEGTKTDSKIINKTK